MYRNDYYNKEEYPTAKVYSLRKEGRTIEAYNLAYSLYKNDSTDDDIKKALAWTLIDLCKKYIADNNFNQVKSFFDLLSTLTFGYEDEFIETIHKQINFLKPKIAPYYAQIQHAEQLSKAGQNKQALDIIRSLIVNNQLSELNHETYGWIIYRYIKAEENNLSSIEVRIFLRDYMKLANERPSMLHSMMLNLALNYSKNHADFNFYNFFKLWNPQNLRYEDYQKGNIDGKTIPSLLVRICRELIKQPKFTPNEIVDLFLSEKDKIIEAFRESYFWLLYNTQQENKLWELFEQYCSIYSQFGKSKWHSEILKIADRFMKENESWRFLSFFKNWNPNNLIDSDWTEEKGEDGGTYKPLAIKTIRKIFAIIKNQQNRSVDDITWLIEYYAKAVNLFPDNEWLIREKALLHIWQKDFNYAKDIYKKLVLELADKFYVWQEFSDCFENDNKLIIGMLSKALYLEKNEDFLGDIHLKLAKILIDDNLLENALFELETYKKHRVEKGWKLTPDFDELYQKASNAKANIKDNTALYKKYISFAEEFAYQDIDWSEVVLIEKWKDDKGKERMTFTNGDSIEFAIGINRFSELQRAKIGQVWNFKLQKQKIKKESETKSLWMSETTAIKYKYLPLLANQSDKNDWDTLEDCFAVIDYINTGKQMIHAITSDNKEVFFHKSHIRLEIGNFITAKSYTKTIKSEKRIELCGIKKVEKQDAIDKFLSKTALVDGTNESKQLFHFVVDSKIQGIVKYNETELRPQEGDFIKIIFAFRFDNKTRKTRTRVLELQATDEVNPNLSKNISGFLEVKFYGSNYDESLPDFAFVNDYYVPKYLLEKHNITTNCKVNARAIFVSDKWKVVEIEKL
jgi:hypothetical protein